MFNRPSQDVKQLQLSGDVAFLRFTVDYDDNPVNQELWSIVGNVHRQMENEMAKELEDILGPDLQVRQVFYRSGSLEIFVILSTAYNVFSTYIDFSDSLNRVVSQLKSFLNRFFRQYAPYPGPPNVTGSWAPGAALMPAQPNAPRQPTLEGASFIPVFIMGAHVITHLALLSAFLWMIFSRF